MNCYENLVCFAENLGMDVVEKKFKSKAKGLCKGSKIGISKEIESNAEKRCILAEEIAHSIFTDGNILDTRDIKNAKQEQFARNKAYEFLLPLESFIMAHKEAPSSLYEMSEILEVTEDFLKQAINYYMGKHGNCVVHDNYVIQFTPFRVIDLSIYSSLIS